MYGGTLTMFEVGKIPNHITIKNIFFIKKERRLKRKTVCCDCDCCS